MVHCAQSVQSIRQFKGVYWGQSRTSCAAINLAAKARRSSSSPSPDRALTNSRGNNRHFVLVHQHRRTSLSKQSIKLVEDQYLRDVRGTNFLQHPLHLRHLLRKIRVGSVHHMKQQICVYRLLWTLAPRRLIPIEFDQSPAHQTVAQARIYV